MRGEDTFGRLYNQYPAVTFLKSIQRVGKLTSFDPDNDPGIHYFFQKLMGRFLLRENYFYASLAQLIDDLLFI